MEKVKIYDFDKTLVEGDSIGVLIKYAIKKGWISPIKFIGWTIEGFFAMLLSLSFERFKDSFVKIVEALSEAQKQEFVNHLLKNYGYSNLINEIKEDGYTTILCSASLYGYMKYVKDILGFDYLICTSHKDGLVIGKNNIKKEKFVNLNSFFKEKGIDVDYENSKSYSDSIKNDKYMMSFTKEKYLINDNRNYEGYHNLRGIKG